MFFRASGIATRRSARPLRLAGSRSMPPKLRSTGLCRKEPSASAPPSSRKEMRPSASAAQMFGTAKRPAVNASARPSGISTRAVGDRTFAVVPVTAPETSIRLSGGSPSVTASSASLIAKSIFIVASGIGRPAVASASSRDPSATASDKLSSRPERRFSTR
jgi:hypothetical protein